MSYISISLYRKVLNHALKEGISREELLNLPTPITSVDSVQAVPADHFFSLHELLDEKLGPGFSVRVINLANFRLSTWHIIQCPRQVKVLYLL